MSVRQLWWRLSCRGTAFGVLFIVLTLHTLGGTTDQPKRVLLLYQDETSMPAERAVDSGIRSILGNKLEIQLYGEHLDTYRFSDPKFQAEQLAWFRNKYRNRAIDLIITTGLLPQTVLPGVPTVFCGIESTGLAGAALPANSTAVWLSPDVKGTLMAAARLQPTAHQVVILSGASEWDRHLELAAQKTLPPSGTNWEITYWDGMSVEEIRSRLGGLPKDTIVLYLSIERDGAGHTYVPQDLVPGFSAVSSAPIYGLSAGFIGLGIVGGSVLDFEAQGKQAAEIGRRILRGEEASTIPPVASSSSYLFDWRELRRFGLSESALPPGSIVKFAVFSPLQLYRRWILSVVAFILLQTAFMVYLLVQKRRRKRAEEELVDLSGRLINAQEAERARIARELHDDFSQRLALLAIQLGQVSQGLPNSDKTVIEKLNLMWEKTIELSTDVHKLSHQLHSSKLHHLGLLAAAKSLCDETGKQHCIYIEFAHREMPEEISPDVGLCFFRILQEALNNIVKHSGAKQAHVEFVGTASQIRLRIVDGGVGFDPNSGAARGGLGLASMRERLRLLGGSIALCSRPTEGTEIVAAVPMAH
jgi:signal transduction histidine kinase